MDGLPVGVLLPDGEVRLHVDFPHAVQCDDVEFAGRTVVFGWIPGGHDDPALRHLLISEGFALQKLEHCGGQRFGNAVDFVNKQNAFVQAGAFHPVVDGGDDLAHGVFRNGVFLPAVGLFLDERQPNGALPRVVRDGIGNQGNAAFARHLLDDLRFSHAGRAHQKQRTLADCGNPIVSVFILLQIGTHGVSNFFLDIFNIHNGAVPPSLPRMDFLNVQPIRLPDLPVPESASWPTAGRPRR